MTRPLAPPGSFSIFASLGRLENFQMKNARMNCAARNEIPASAMVSDICSSIRCPWSRDVLRRRPGMSQDGDRRSNCNYDDRHCKELRHDVSFPPASISGFALNRSAQANRRPLLCQSALNQSSERLRSESVTRTLSLRLEREIGGSGLAAATVTFAVCVPYSSCQAVTV